MISAWELKFVPTNDYPNRYSLKLKCDSEDIEEVYRFLKEELKLEVSTPFSVLSTNYDVGMYIYNISEDVKNKIKEKLFSVCKRGTVEDQSSKGEEVSQKRDDKEKLFPEELSKLLSGLVEEISGKVIEPNKTSTEPRTTTAYSQDQTMRLYSIPLNPKYTFENFVIGANNRFTHAAALAVAENPGKTYNPLFIYGGVGLGKTHLMQAIGHYIKKKRPMLKVVYIPSDKFVAQVIDSIRAGTIQMLRDTYSNVDVLLVDDVQFMAESESTQEEFFHIFNTLHQLGKQIVLTSDRPPKLLSTLEDRLRSRFEWGLIADIKSPSLETRVAILKKKSEEENVNVDENILLYVASKLKSNIRELEGFLKRITAYAVLNNQPINMELVKQLMSELLPEEELTDEEKALLQAQQKVASSVSPQQQKVTPQAELIPPQISTVQPSSEQLQTQSQKTIKSKQVSLEEIYQTSQPSSSTVGSSPSQPSAPHIAVDEQKF
ncbi:MAG: chromosomal replication initiator protein DnaA, partial [Endomicrobia bacterium]|nr:chromosomal replication initiator protein DnaA [Endomicrobiia bacterium]